MNFRTSFCLLKIVARVRHRGKKINTQIKGKAYIKKKHRKTQINQTKTKLSLQGPQWSRHSVARVRRRGEKTYIWLLYSIFLIYNVNLSISMGVQEKNCLYLVENGMGVAT